MEIEVQPMPDTSIKKPVPFVDLSVQHAALRQEIDRAINDVFAQSSFVLGKAVSEFEEDFASYCGAKYCVALNSGTAALHLALLAMGVGPGDEVITPANSFIATAEAISFCGAVPRLVDADIETANIDAGKIEAAISEKTRVILPVHLYGQPARMDKIKSIAADRGLPVLEDACQAHGARFKGKRAGVLGEAACFSFYPGKNLGAAGDGGAFVTDNVDLAETVRLLRNHGSSQKYHHLLIGHNFRLDSIQAAILKVKLPHLDKWNEARRQIADFYNRRLQQLPGIKPIRVVDEAESVFHLYVIRVDDRSVVESVFKELQISYGIHYPIPIHLQPAYRELGLGEGSFPNSEALAKSIISLPMYPELSHADQERVVVALSKASDLMRER